MLTIEEVKTEAGIDTARELFREYERWLGLDLCFQGFKEELRTLPGKYASPDGKLILAHADGQAAGCVAMRKFADRVCEMKRLYVRPNFTGNGIGRALIEAIITAARDEGYEKMLLDTYPQKMGTAVRLYRSYGFADAAAHYANPHAGVLFMELDLSR